MVRAWRIDDSDDEQKQPHHLDPPQFVDLDFLKTLGVLCWKVDADNLKEEGVLDKIRKDRGYDYEDVVTVTRDKFENYDERLKMFFQEHMHSHDEISVALEGSSYFDVRNKADKWVRIEFEKGDMLMLPAGIYHRFTLDAKNNYIKAIRLFVGEPKGGEINRPADDHPSRVEYVQQIGIE